MPFTEDEQGRRGGQLRHYCNDTAHNLTLQTNLANGMRGVCMGETQNFDLLDCTFGSNSTRKEWLALLPTAYRTAMLEQFGLRITALWHRGKDRQSLNIII